MKRLIGDRDARGIIQLLRERYQPKDVLVQQKKVARAEALVFVAPVHFLSFPAMLKGWLDRVWTPGFAYDRTEDAWRGDINGRRPKLTHKKALIIQTTIFDKRAYDAASAQLKRPQNDVRRAHTHAFDVRRTARRPLKGIRNRPFSKTSSTEGSGWSVLLGRCSRSLCNGITG